MQREINPLTCSPYSFRNLLCFSQMKVVNLGDLTIFKNKRESISDGKEMQEITQSSLHFHNRGSMSTSSQAIGTASLLSSSSLSSAFTELLLRIKSEQSRRKRMLLPRCCSFCISSSESSASVCPCSCTLPAPTLLCFSFPS